jgi:hypothetical protein
MNRSLLRFALGVVVTAALAGVVVPNAASRPVDRPWAGTGTGTTTVVSDGPSGPAVFTYSATGFEGSWTFSTVANRLDEDEDEDAVDEVDEDEDEDLEKDQDGGLEEDEDDGEDEEEDLDGNTRTVPLAWTYEGFHSFFEVTVGLDAFVTHGATTTTTPLVNAGPVNCCTPPSGGFAYSGTASLSVQAGDTYGFAMRGSNFDIARTLSGTLTVDDPRMVDDSEEPLRGPPGTARQPVGLGCAVPRLAGKTARRAKILLRKANCALGRISKEKVGKKVRAGRVLRSKPRAGTHLSRGAKVAVVVGRR